MGGEGSGARFRRLRPGQSPRRCQSAEVMGQGEGTGPPGGRELVPSLSLSLPLPQGWLVVPCKQPPSVPPAASSSPHTTTSTTCTASPKPSPLAGEAPPWASQPALHSRGGREVGWLVSGSWKEGKEITHTAHGQRCLHSQAQLGCCSAPQLGAGLSPLCPDHPRCYVGVSPKGLHVSGKAQIGGSPVNDLITGTGLTMSGIP